MALSRSQSVERVTPIGFGKAVLFVLFGAFATGMIFVWLAPIRGPVHSVSFALGSVALGVAGAERFFVVAYVGIGLARLYLTGIPLLLFFGGIAAALTDRRWSLPMAVLLGAAGAGTLTVLTGCHCASGSATFLVQRAVGALMNGTAPIVVG